jgi:molecular chaperone HtpG
VNSERQSFRVGIEFQSILRAISKQIYETPLAFIRENVQNAVDAIRIQAFRDGASPAHAAYRIDVTVGNDRIRVRDNGCGMTPAELEGFFWTIGASGKRTPEALAAGCVGMFGIGGFANFGVCNALEVTSQVAGSDTGTATRLSEEDIRAAGASIPYVTVAGSDAASPRGTVVDGLLRASPNVEELKRYLQDFVRYVPTAVYFNGEMISQVRFSDLDQRENLTPITGALHQWNDGNLAISGMLYEDRGYTLAAAVEGMMLNDEKIALVGRLRFENGAIDAFKRGFKLCGTQVGSTIGVSGRLDCDRFVPTAGRDSLDADTMSLLGRIVSLLERVAVEAVLETPQRIAQNARVFRYVLQKGLVSQIGRANVRLADGSEVLLEDIRRRSEQGGVGVFFGTTQKQDLNQIMQARGHVVVLLSADRYRQGAERSYLETYCSAKPFDGMIDCAERYENLTRFEKVFLSEMELIISRSYEVARFHVVAGKLTEDIPAFVKDISGSQVPEIFIDVRHPEITKLEYLGYSQLLYSLIATFCREYLGPSLKKWSPRFFGDGAINLELLAKRRSEFWVLIKDDIGVVHKTGQRHVVTRSDVRVVSIANPNAHIESNPDKPFPRILQIVDDRGEANLGGYYIRLPDTAFTAYGDLLPECESRGVVWSGNKILFNASDTVSASFHYEIRLDEVVSSEINGTLRSEGAIALDRPFQELFSGLYFPIPVALERFLVPQGADEIRLQLQCDWFDMRTARHWTQRSSDAA